MGFKRRKHSQTEVRSGAGEYRAPADQTTIDEVTDEPDADATDATQSADARARTEELRVYSFCIGNQRVAIVRTRAWDPDIEARLPTRGVRAIYRQLLMGASYSEIAAAQGISDSWLRQQISGLHQGDERLADTREQIARKLSGPVVTIATPLIDEGK